MLEDDGPASLDSTGQPRRGPDPFIAHAEGEIDPPPFKGIFPFVFGGGICLLVMQHVAEKRRRRRRGLPATRVHSVEVLEVKVPLIQEAASEQPPAHPSGPSASPDTVMEVPQPLPAEFPPALSWQFAVLHPLERVEHRVVAAAEVRRFAGLFWQLASSGAVQVGSNWYVKSPEPAAACGFEPCVDPDNVLVAGAMMVRYTTRELAAALVENDRSCADKILCGAAGVAAKLCTRLELIEEMATLARVATQNVFGEARYRHQLSCNHKFRRCELRVLSRVPTASCAYCNPVDEFDQWMLGKYGSVIAPHDAALCHSIATVLTLSMLLFYDTCDCEQVVREVCSEHRAHVFFEAVCALACDGVSTGDARRALTPRRSMCSLAAARLLRESSAMAEDGFKHATLMLRMSPTDRLARACTTDSMLHAASRLSR